MVTDTEEAGEELTDRDRLRWCLENLGVRNTAVALRELSAIGVQAWAEETVDVPDEVKPRLSVLHQAGSVVTEAYGPETARAFLRSSSPYLGDIAPIMLIRGSETETELEPRVQEQIAGAVDFFLE